MLSISSKDALSISKSSGDQSVSRSKRSPWSHWNSTKLRKGSLCSSRKLKRLRICCFSLSMGKSFHLKYRRISEFILLICLNLKSSNLRLSEGGRNQLRPPLESLRRRNRESRAWKLSILPELVKTSRFFKEKWRSGCKIQQSRVLNRTLQVRKD